MSENMFKIQLTSTEAAKTNSSQDLEIDFQNTDNYNIQVERDNSNSQSELIYKLIGFKLHEAIRYFIGAFVFIFVYLKCIDFSVLYLTY